MWMDGIGVILFRSMSVLAETLRLAERMKEA